MCCITLIIVSILTFAALKYVEFRRRRNLVDDISNKHVLITGCDSGFGKKLAKDLDKLGVRVIASCLTEDGAAKLRRECSSRLKTLILDVTNDESIEKAVGFVKKCLQKDQGQGLWGLVNNAGLQVISAPLEFWSKQDVERTLRVNLFGTIYVTKAFLPLLRKAKGRIVHLSSDAALIPWPCRSVYNISKISLESFSACLRRELYYTGVTSHTVQPGSFRTGIFDPADVSATLQKAYDRSEEEIRNFYGKNLVQTLKDAAHGVPAIQNPNLSEVTDAITHALLSTYPKYVYQCGWDCNWKYYPMSLVPYWFSDWYYAMPAPDAVK